MTMKHKAPERKDAGGGREVRSFALQIKAAGEDGTLEGYGSVFGVRDNYDDVIAKGAFVQSLNDHKAAGTMPAMLWQHDADKPIGIWTEMVMIGLKKQWSVGMPCTPKRDLKIK